MNPRDSDCNFFGQASENHNFKNISSDMDFLLLASHIQKSLTISANGVDIEDNQRRVTSVSGESSCANMDFKRSKLRSSAYLEDIEVYKCSLCSISCSTKDLLIKHALRIHHKAVVALLQNGSTEQHLKCRFCVHKVMLRHQKLLLLHLEKKHATEFLSFFKQSCVSSAKPQDTSKHVSSNVSTPLQNNVAAVSLFKNDNNMIKQGPIFHGVHKNELFKDPSDNKKSCHQLFNRSYAKRKLVLDDTLGCRPYTAEVMKENVPPVESFSVVLAGSAWKHAKGKHFACGRCKEAFSCNALLLDHVSVRHRGPLRLLQPLFTCGLCSASFYKNSFLVRHCYRHHTPQ